MTGKKPASHDIEKCASVLKEIVVAVAMLCGMFVSFRIWSANTTY